MTRLQNAESLRNALEKAHGKEEKPVTEEADKEEDKEKETKKKPRGWKYQVGGGFDH